VSKERQRIKGVCSHNTTSLIRKSMHQQRPALWSNGIADRINLFNPWLGEYVPQAREHGDTWPVAQTLQGEQGEYRRLSTGFHCASTGAEHSRPSWTATRRACRTAASSSEDDAHVSLCGGPATRARACTVREALAAVEHDTLEAEDLAGAGPTAGGMSAAAARTAQTGTCAAGACKHGLSLLCVSHVPVTEANMVQIADKP
jgi:hypothetical protein